MDRNDSEFIWVKGGKNSPGNRVAIVEHDDLHPNGVAYVYGDEPKQVYPTPEVVLRMREGFLEEARFHPERIVIIGAAASVEAVHHEIVRQVAERLGIGV